MAAYNLFLGAITKDVFTNEGGTALAILGREVTQPTLPSSTLKASSGTAGATDKATLTLPEALIAELNAGAKVIALTVWFNAKGAGTAVRWKFGTITPAVSGENVIEAATQRWNSVAFTKAQAEEQTKASLEALEVFIEHVTATTVACMEIYVALETEAGAETKTVSAFVHGAGQTTVSAQKIASASVKVTGAGLPVASVAHVANVTAKVTGAGLARVVLSGAVTVTALVHGAGRATASVGHVGIATAAVTGAGRATATAGGIRTASALVHGAGAVAAPAAKIASVAGLVHGAGRMTVAPSHVAAATARVTGAGLAHVSTAKTSIVSALVHGGGLVTVKLTTGAVVALVHGGGRATVSVTYFMPTPQFPTSAPIPGHVAVARRGRLNRNKGHLATTRAGRSGT